VNPKQDIPAVTYGPALCHCFCQASHPETATTMTCVSPAEPQLDVIRRDELVGLTRTPMCTPCHTEHGKRVPPPEPAIRQRLADIEAEIEEYEGSWDWPPVFHLLTADSKIPIGFDLETLKETGGHPVPLLAILRESWPKHREHLGISSASILAVVCVFVTWYLLPRTEAEVENFRDIQARGRVWAHPDRQELRVCVAWQRDGGCAVVSRFKGQPVSESEDALGDVTFAVAQTMEAILEDSP
jgi:hypothetical protein